MVVVTGGASLEMRTHTRNRLVRIHSGKLQLDISIELLEALVAVSVRASGPSSARSKASSPRKVMLAPFLRRWSFHEWRGTRGANANSGRARHEMISRSGNPKPAFAPRDVRGRRGVGLPVERVIVHVLYAPSRPDFLPRVMDSRW